MKPISYLQKLQLYKNMESMNHVAMNVDCISAVNPICTLPQIFLAFSACHTLSCFSSGAPWKAVTVLALPNFLTMGPS